MLTRYQKYSNLANKFDLFERKAARPEKRVNLDTSITDNRRLGKFFYPVKFINEEFKS